MPAGKSNPRSQPPPLPDKPVSREQAQDMIEAHAQGFHSGLPREGCPECEDRPLRGYPPAEGRSS